MLLVADAACRALSKCCIVEVGVCCCGEHWQYCAWLVSLSAQTCILLLSKLAAH